MKSVFPHKSTGLAAKTVAKLYIFTLIVLACVATPLTAEAVQSAHTSSTYRSTNLQRNNRLDTDDGYCHITNKLDGHHVLDIQGNADSPGTDIITYPRNMLPTDNQLWKFVPDSANNGYGFIQSQESGLVLDMPNAQDTPPLTPIIAHTKNVPSTDNQLWKVPNKNTYGFIQSKVTSKGRNLVLDIKGVTGSTDNPGPNGTPIDAFTKITSGPDNQLWKVGYDSNKDGYGFIQSKIKTPSGSHIVLDIQGARSSGAPIIAYTRNIVPTDNQLWEFVPDSANDGYGFIQNQNGLVLDIRSQKTTIEAFTKNTSGPDNQLWKFTSRSDDGYGFIQSKQKAPSRGMLVIDVPKHVFGQNVEVFIQDNPHQDNQLWQFPCAS